MEDICNNISIDYTSPRSFYDIINLYRSINIRNKCNFGLDFSEYSQPLTIFFYEGYSLR